MFEKSLGLLFYIRKPKSYTDGLLPIYLRITVDVLIERSELSDRFN